MKEMITVLKEATDRNWGNSVFFILLGLSLLIILLSEKDNIKKILMGYYPLCMLLLIYTPLMYLLAQYLFGTKELGAYYCRFFLMIPIFFIIAYALTLLLQKCGEKKLVVGIVLVSAAIMCCGHTFYQDDWYSRAENYDKVPNEAIELCELIDNQGEDVCAMFPPEMLIYIRQINASIRMPYGRSGQNSVIAQNLISENPDIQYVLDYAKEYQADYIVCAKTEVMQRSLSYFSCEIVGTTENYMVVKPLYDE
jgi:hypothetical protein